MKTSGAAALFDRPVHVTVEAPTIFEFARYLEYVLAPPILGRHELYAGIQRDNFCTFAEVPTADFFLLSSMPY
jgi:hypothetical protein